ncbi:MAG: hypothetical protein GZ091_05915 [Paludibacter sp.]|nr:hypothetical protein [Paludibacter sp.]
MFSDSLNINGLQARLPISLVTVRRLENHSVLDARCANLTYTEAALN